MLNAQRQQLFAGRYLRQEPLWRTIAETEIVDDALWLEALPAGLAVTGSGLARLRERLPAGVVVVDEAQWAPQAATAGRLGYLAYQSGQRDELWKLSPRYYRKSAAEEVWEAKHAGGTGL